MIYEFFSIRGPKQEVVAECVKSRENTLCDSPLTQEPLDVVKFESAPGFDQVKYGHYFARNRKVRSGLLSVLDEKVKILKKVNDNKAHGIAVDVSEPTVKFFEKSYELVTSRSRSFLALIENAFAHRGRLCVPGDSKGGKDGTEAIRFTLRATVLSGNIKDSDKQITINGSITSPSLAPGEKERTLTIHVGEDIFIYPFSSLPPTLQGIIKEFKQCPPSAVPSTVEGVGAVI